MGIQYSVHSPNQFICTNRQQLLPGWMVPVLSVLVVLQECPSALLDKTLEIEDQKHELRSQFIRFASQVVYKLQEMGYSADLFDPRTGLPLFSQPGQLQLDDVAVVQDSLGYPLAKQGGCTLIKHPLWGCAVYPSILVASADPSVVVAVAHQVMATFI